MLNKMKSGFAGRKIIIGIASVITGLFLATGVAFAAPGNAVQPPIPVCVGIGVAFDGTDILYTCANDPSIHKTDLTGANNGTVATVDAAGSPVSVDAIAWDSNENKLWGGDLDSANNLCRIWKIDMSSGVASLEFSFTDLHGGCNFSFFDGLTVDTVSNTLWLSPDIHRFIHHYTKAGVEIAADLIAFEALTAGQCPWAAGFGGTGCWNSGLTIGLDGNLFAGTASDGKIYQLNPGPPASLIGQFASVSGRDEDLECGPVVGGKETILSKQFEGPIDVLEAPQGTCQSPVVPQITLDPPTATNAVGDNHTVTATVTSGGSPVVGTLVSFSVSAGPNVGQVSDPGECSIDPNCNTDPSGQTSWTYTGSGGVGVDVIQACFTDGEGEEHCTEVKKEWVDRTPPKAACLETVNPHGKTVPPAGSTTLPGPRGGQNEDGYYELLASDNLPGLVQIFVNGFGPFSSSDKIKVTEAPGATPSQKKIGSALGQAGAILWHLILNSDPVMTAVDAAGNKTTVSCLVPPPPK